jgi:hypothetical protein
MPRTVAVMQPYLYPYGGYFQLLAASDTFVVFDDVQFMRRGRVHRCEVNAGRWLTLPLRHKPRETLINELEFAPDARLTFDERLVTAGIPRHSADYDLAAICSHLYGPLGSVVDFLEAGLRNVARVLHLDVEIIRSSTLGSKLNLRGQARIISIVNALGGARYLNASGGRELYDAHAFAAAGIELQFLGAYSGNYCYLLPGLLRGGCAPLRQELQDLAPELGRPSRTTRPRLGGGPGPG